MTSCVAAGCRYLVPQNQSEIGPRRLLLLRLSSHSPHPRPPQPQPTPPAPWQPPPVQPQPSPPPSPPGRPSEPWGPPLPDPVLAPRPISGQANLSPGWSALRGGRGGKQKPNSSERGVA